MESLSNNGILFNEAIFKAILHDLEKESKKCAGQPQILIGVSGSGKTFLLRRLFDAASTHSGLVPTWIDGRAVFSNKDMLCISHKGRSVLFVDDFHYYLQRTSNEEQFALRGILSEKGGPILIATAPAVMPQLTHYEAALFEGFRIHYLKPLSDNYRLIIGHEATKITRAKALMAYLPQTPGAAYMVKEIIDNSSSDKEDIMLLVKRMSPLYQNTFDKLLPQQQRIMCALASCKTEGLKLSDIRNITGQESGKISPYITQMLESGLITKESRSARGAKYRITDPLFNLWLPKRSI